MRAFLLFVFALLPSPIAAQYWGSIDMSLPISNSQFILSQQIVTMSTPSLRDPDSVWTGRDEDESVDKAPSLLVPTAPVNGGAKLASSYPPAQRQEAKRLFAELLAGHGKLMQQFGIARNDMAGAVAAFIAGSHAAYHDRDIDESDFQALVAQMRRTLAANPAFGAASPAERRNAFEQLAILGMMAATVQTALKENPQHPDADRIRANMRKSGGDYLRGFLSVSPDKVTLGPKGLSLAR